MVRSERLNLPRSTVADVRKHNLQLYTRFVIFQKLRVTLNCGPAHQKTERHREVRTRAKFLDGGGDDRKVFSPAGDVWS